MTNSHKSLGSTSSPYLIPPNHTKVLLEDFVLNDELTYESVSGDLILIKSHRSGEIVTVKTAFSDIMLQPYDIAITHQLVIKESCSLDLTGSFHDEYIIQIFAIGISCDLLLRRTDFLRIGVLVRVEIPSADHCTL